MDLDKLISNVNNIQKKIATDVWPNGWSGTCHKCGKPFSYTSAECSYYLRNGWPKCDHIYQEDNMEDPNALLINHIPEITEALKAQLIEDGKRWGDTWRHRITQGQEERIYAELNSYYDQWKYAGTPIPWLKVMGLALIALVRINHPELLLKDKE